MADCMVFPATLDEFLEQYQFQDSEEVYTNGAMLIPVFRVKQWLEHAAVDAVEVVRCRECSYYAVTKDNDLHLKVSGCYRLKKLGEEYPLVVQGEGFCSWGQRREDGTDNGK